MLAREGWVELRHGSGTYVLERVDERPVGVFLDLDISLSEMSYFWRRVAQQVRLRLRASGFHSRLYAGHYRPGDDDQVSHCPDLAEDVAGDRLSGLVLLWGHLPKEMRQLFRRRRIPCVAGFKGFDASVSFDRKPALRDAVKSLLAEGRRKLAFMGWAPGIDPRHTRDEMLSVFARELASQGIEMNADWIRCDIAPTLRGAGWSTFREIWTASSEKPDGLIVTDDVLFRAAAWAIQEIGIRVPQQLRIVTHANTGDDLQVPFPVSRMEADPDAFAQALVDQVATLVRRQPLKESNLLLPLQFVASPNDAIASAPADQTSKKK
jgi:DNA-binding LacI/PurR family transcriptional regulator